MKKIISYFLASKYKETIAGALFVGVMGFMVMFLYEKKAVNPNNGALYAYAIFNKADGLLLGADVRIAGINIGKVIDMHLFDNNKMRLKIGFTKKYDLAIDSSLAIETDGILGGKYIEILPGGDWTNIKNGDTFSYTQDALILSELMDKINAYMRDKKAPQPPIDATIEIEKE